MTGEDTGCTTRAWVCLSRHTIGGSYGEHDLTGLGTAVIIVIIIGVGDREVREALADPADPEDVHQAASEAVAVAQAEVSAGSAEPVDAPAEALAASAEAAEAEASVEVSAAEEAAQEASAAAVKSK